jgi:CRP-like cAMP-binding protein
VAGLGDRVAALARQNSAIHLAENLDWASEWCEDELIADHDPQGGPAPEVPLAGNDFFHDLDRITVEKLMALAEPGTASAGDVLIEAGAAPTRIFLLLRGEVSVTIDLPYQERVRLATHSAGMAFGYMALLDKSPQAADYHTDTDVEYATLAVDDVMAVAESDPALLAAVYRSVGQSLASQLHTATREIQALST